jgi:hypothetical protein
MVFPVTTRPRVAGPKAKTANQDRKGQITAPVENALLAMTDRETANPDQSLQQTSERSPSADEIFNLPDVRSSYRPRRGRDHCVVDRGEP